MLSQALALALAASIYPPAVAAVIALGRGADVRRRVLAFVLAAMLVTYAMGTLILLVLIELGATGSHHLTPSAAIDLALGVLLILLAARLYVKRPNTAAAGVTEGAGMAGTVEEAAPGGAPSKIERYLQSRRLAFVLGMTLYILPSPIYIGAVKSVADAHLSRSGELLALVVIVAVMLWLIELPMLMLLVAPDRASRVLEAINLWFARNGRSLAIAASAAVGLYLIVKGVVDLID
jgi:Sap, sulfolipid-1-addressing protein